MYVVRHCSSLIGEVVSLLLSQVLDCVITQWYQTTLVRKFAPVFLLLMCVPLYRDRKRNLTAHPAYIFEICMCIHSIPYLLQQSLYSYQRLAKCAVPEVISWIIPAVSVVIIDGVMLCFNLAVSRMSRIGTTPNRQWDYSMFLTTIVASHEFFLCLFAASVASNEAFVGILVIRVVRDVLHALRMHIDILRWCRGERFKPAAIAREVERQTSCTCTVSIAFTVIRCVVPRAPAAKSFGPKRVC